ncbi:MAG: gamma-glutamyl-gamma-aminobutyrate hydrolase family protein [Desertimonas sp.]
MTRPLIGLTGRTCRAGATGGFPEPMADLMVEIFVEAYARAIHEAGGLPVHLPEFLDPTEFAGRLDGLVLTGGADVDPARYGAPPDPELGALEPDRDRFELGLVDVAMGEDLPILGICRGVQVLNVWGGGTLHQHVPAHARWDRDPQLLVDEVAVEVGTRLHALYGGRRRINSLHHQTIDRVANGFIVAARAADGVVEGLEMPGREVLGVHWHPEMLAGRADDPVFAWLVERATARARGAASGVGR